MGTEPPKESYERYYTWVLRKLKERDGGQMEIEDVERMKHQQYLAKEAGVDLSEEFDAVTSPDHYTRLLIQPINKDVNLLYIINIKLTNIALFASYLKQ